MTDKKMLTIEISGPQKSGKSTIAQWIKECLVASNRSFKISLNDPDLNPLDSKGLWDRIHYLAKSGLKIQICTTTTSKGQGKRNARSRRTV